MLRFFAFAALLVSAVIARPQEDDERFEDELFYDEDYEYQCNPDLDGDFPDILQCDKYWTCEDGEATSGLCPDGYVIDFEETERTGKHSCINPIKPNEAKDIVGSCAERPILQTPQPSADGRCPRRNGFYVNPENCNAYLVCSNGGVTDVVCPTGLVFDPDTFVCVWDRGDNIKREGCTVKESACPEKDPASPYQTARWPHETECNSFYYCLNGEPKLGGCDGDMVYNEFEWKCDEPENVYGECGDRGDYPGLEYVDEEV